LERHIERLFDSAKAIRLDIPASRDEIAELVLETCRRNEIDDGYIRLVITRGAGDLGIDPRSCPQPDIIVIAKRVGALYGAKPWQGVTVVTSAFRRHAPDVLSPSIKSLNYLNNIMARIEANDRGADEALFLDQQGHVAEATVDNLFIVVDRTLMTPPTATNLKGITRETVLELAADLGIRTEERPFTLFDVWTAREAFMCGTMAEIVPVASVDGRTIGHGASGAPGAPPVRCRRASRPPPIVWFDRAARRSTACRWPRWSSRDEPSSDLRRRVRIAAVRGQSGCRRAARPTTGRTVDALRRQRDECA